MCIRDRFNPLPQGNSLNCVYALDSLNIWAAGGYATIMKSTDGGESWIVIRADSSCCWEYIKLFDRNNGVVVDLSGNIFKTRDGFNTIEAVDTGNRYGEVIFPEYYRWWLLTTTALYLSEDLGESWYEVKTTNFNNFNHIYFSDRMHGWLCIQGNNFFRTVDGGETWSWVPGNNKYTYYRKILFLNEKTGFAVAKKSDREYVILKTEDGGITWKESFTTRNFILKVTFIDEKIGFILPEYYYQLYHTSDCGETWDTLRYNYYGGMTDVFFINDKTGWMVGRYGGVLKTTDGGRNWNLKTDFKIGPGCYHTLFFSDRNNGWITGNKVIINIKNDGKDIVKFKCSETIWELKFINKNLAYGRTPGSKILKVNFTENGVNITDVKLPEHIGILYDYYFVDENTGWLVKDWGDIFHTTDGGLTWVKQATLEGRLTGIFFVDENTGWITGKYKIYKTDDGGETWTEYKNDFIIEPDDILFINKLTGWIADGHNLLKTTDGGKTFTRKVQGKFECIRDIFFLNENIGYVGGIFPHIYKTTDGGEKWEPMRRMPIGINKIFFIDEDNGWAMYDRGPLILKYSVIPDSSNSVLPANFYLYQCYPNPFNTETTIRFSLKISQKVSIKIYDILGREVITLVNKEFDRGYHTIKWNGKNRDGITVSSGVYLYIIKTEKFSSAKKMVFLK